MNKETKQKLVPIWERVNLTLEEASAYSGIVEGEIDVSSEVGVGSTFTVKLRRAKE